MDDEAGSWYSYEGGDTINDLGPEGGYVLRDEELGDPEDLEDADARLTLEQGRADNPGYFLTANLYGGWMYHVVKRSTEAEAATLYEAFKPELVNLAAQIPMDDDRDVPRKVQLLLEAVAAFEQRFD
ncbi:MAG: hypothetical protein H7Z41_13545 [Cytophagales bacterium]|nr:hypothetical protein [Armatimonadota bacterium]